MPEHIAKNIKKLELLLELAEQLTDAQLDNVLLYTHAFIDGVNYDPAKRGEFVYRKPNCSLFPSRKGSGSVVVAEFWSASRWRYRLARLG